MADVSNHARPVKAVPAPAISTDTGTVWVPPGAPQWLINPRNPLPDEIGLALIAFLVVAILHDLWKARKPKPFNIHDYISRG